MSKRTLQILLILISGLLALSLLALAGLAAWGSSPQMIQVRVVVPQQWQPYIDWLLKFPGRSPGDEIPRPTSPVRPLDSFEF